jgi:hypothetical protein
MFPRALFARSHLLASQAGGLDILRLLLKASGTDSRRRVLEKFCSVPMLALADLL